MTSQPSSWRNILLMRHGATALNSDDHTVDRIRGWTDWPLSENGRREAVALVGRIVEIPDVLLCSNLTRARQTAEIAADILGCPLHMTADFLPWDVGLYVGANAADTMPKLARFAVRSHLVVPGGESFDRFRTRFLLGLRKALNRYPGLIGIVTHYRCERLLKALAKAGYPENGAIDLDEFTRKGGTTGHCEMIRIPTDRLDLFADWLSVQNMPSFGDGREETYREYLDHGR